MHLERPTMKAVVLSLIAVVVAGGCRRPAEPVSRSGPPPSTPPAAMAPRPAPRPVRSPSALVPGDESVVPPADRPAPLSPKLAEALRQFQALANDPEQRETVVNDVAALGDEGVPKAGIAETLGKMFHIEPTIELRINILEQLGGLETPAAFDPIVVALASGQPAEVQEAGLSAMETLMTDLSFQEDQWSLTVIQRGVDSGLPQAVRLAAISAMEDRQDAHATTTLQGLLNDPDAEVREAAKDALEWLQNK